MRLSSTVLFSFLLLLFLGCSKKDADPATPDGSEAPEKPMPQGSSKLAIQVDAAYDLTNTRAASLVDSISMHYKNPDLFVPVAEPSMAFFLEKGTNKVMAVVRTDPQQTTLKVTAQTVTEGLYDLLPAYHNLTPALQKKFEQEVLSTPIYKEFSGLVDQLLKNKKTVYSTDPDFLKKVGELNLHIIKTYLDDLKDLDDPDRITGKTGKKGGINTTHKGMPGDVKAWLRKDGSVIENQVYGYVGVTLNGETEIDQKFTLEPRPMFIGQSTQSFSKYNDDYYQVTVSQKSDEIVQKNTQEAVKKLVELSISYIFGKSSSTCHDKIKDVIAAKAIMAIQGINSAESIPDLLSGFFSETATGIKDLVLSDKLCGIDLIFSAVGSKMSWLSTAFNVAFTVRDGVQIAGLVMSVNEPVEFTESIQVYNSELKTGQAKVVIKEDVKAFYKLGEVARPVIAIVQDYAFDDFSLTGFTVDWKVEDGNGKMGALKTTTGTAGLTTGTWAMPQTLDKEEVTLVAEVKDKEGNPILGSPLTFKTQLICETPISFSTSGLTNLTSKIMSDTLTIKEYTIPLNFKDPCNMIKRAKEAYVRVTWTNLSDNVPHPFDHDLKGFAGSAEFTFNLGGATHWYRNRQTGQYCCYTNYKIELFVDGKSYGSAAVGGPGPQ